MIIQLEENISQKDLENLRQRLDSIQYQCTEVNTQFQKYIIGVGKKEFDIREIGTLSGIMDIHRVSDAYKLVSKKWRVDDSIVDLGDGVKIGTNHFEIMAGPCSIESEAQIEQTLEHLIKNNIKIMRGGVYKPRSSPYSFRGLGQEGLVLWAKKAKEVGIKIITEVMMTSQIDAMLPYVDVFQVGARNSQNFNLLDALGQVDKPVMLKRGISGTINELLQAAEYIFSNGNEKIMLCERGIRSYETAYRNTLDINAIPILKEKSHLPLIVDPSHGIGLRKHVSAVALAGVMAGADAVIMEVHSNPAKAFSDGQQTLSFPESEKAFKGLRECFKLRQELR